MKTYLFYDVETSGLNPAFDQMLTFACVRTDLALTEISRELITIKLRRDIIPSPHAFITHCLTQEELETGITEYQAALRIHALFNTPGTISLGYNSLGFDDEFLRFLFYRNLLDPYAHQYANHCSRMDLLPVTALFRVFCDQVIKWPYLEGRPSLKLELLSRENSFVTSGRAHEAMADVEAVIELARIFSRQQDIWEYALAFFNKTKDTLRINTMEKGCRIGTADFRICFMVSSSFGPKNNYIAPVIHVGDSVPYKNQSLWIRLDHENAFKTDGFETDETQIFDLFVIRKRPGDQLIVLPSLDRFASKLTPRARKASAQNIKKIQSHPDRFFKTIQQHQEYRYPLVPDIDLDAALYQSGFFSSSEKKQISRFHSAADKNKVLECERFPSGRIKDMAARILLRNFEDHHPGGGGGEAYTDHLRRLLSTRSEDQIKGFRNDVKYGAVQGMRDLEKIQENEDALTPLQKEILAWLKGYLERLISPDTELF